VTIFSLRDGYNYLTCRRKTDDLEDGLVNEMVFTGPIFGNPIFQEFEDVSPINLVNL
jgi:hypothetical protein